MNLEIIKAQIAAAIAEYGGKILLAIVVFTIGRFIIGKLTKVLSGQMNRGKIDRDVQPFLLSLITVLLNVMLLLSCAGILGIQTTSFVAILGAAGLAVGLALQGSLANFAGGVLILIFKPFRVGDLVTAQGFTGHVEAINIFNTVLITPDNKTIILPNGSLSTDAITNVSGKGAIRVDMVFGAGAPNGVDKIRASIKKVIDACPYATKDREHDILVTKLTENAIFFDTRVWTTPDTYWETYYNIHENISKQFTADGIVAPAPAPVHVVMEK
jgi:small conductance mechanosensitive channel